MIRLVSLLKRADGIAPEAFDIFRRDELGPFVAGTQVRMGLLRYVQTHRDRASPEVEAGFVQVRPGLGRNFDGIDEYWWLEEDACRAALADPDGAYADITRSQKPWVDAAGSTAWLAVEYPQVATAPGRTMAAPKSGLMRLIFAVAPRPSMAAEAARQYWLTQHGPLIRRFAPARGTLAYNQVHRFERPMDSGFLPAGFAQADHYIGHAEAWFAETAAASGADRESAMEAAVTDERKFIDWSRSSVFAGKELAFVDRSWL